MDRAAGLETLFANSTDDFNLGARRSGTHREVGSSRCLAVEIHSQQTLQHRGGWVDDGFRQFHRVEATDGMLGGDIAMAVPTAAPVSDGSHQLQSHAVVVAQLNHILPRGVCGPVGLYAETGQMLYPKSE